MTLTVSSVTPSTGEAFVIYDVGAKTLENDLWTRSTMARIPIMLWDALGVLVRLDVGSEDMRVFEVNLFPQIKVGEQMIGDTAVCFEIFVVDGKPTVPLSLYWAINAVDARRLAGSMIRDFVAAIGLTEHEEDWEYIFGDEAHAMRHCPILSSEKRQWVQPEFGELELYRVLGQMCPMFLPWSELAAFVEPS